MTAAAARRRPLRRLRPASIDTAAVWEQARAQADREAATVSEAARLAYLRHRGAWPGGDNWPPDERALLMDAARDIYAGHRSREIAAALTAAARARRDEEHAAAARAEVAAAYGLDMADLTPETAAALLADAEERATDLGRPARRYQAGRAAQRRPRAAATRAQTHRDRLEDYLVAAGLISYPDAD